MSAGVLIGGSRLLASRVKVAAVLVEDRETVPMS
jgi:hypothetical protein